MRGFEASVVSIDSAVLHPTQPAFDSGTRLTGDRILTRFDSLHVDRDRAAGDHSVLSSGARLVSNVGAGHQRLGRDTAGIDTGSAKELALDYCDLSSGLRETSGQRGASLTGPNDNGVKLGSHLMCVTISRPQMMAIASSMSATGRSLPNAAASRPLNSAPPSVPATAPMAPAARPPHKACCDAPIA